MSDFYPRKVYYYCPCLRAFLERVYTEECLRSEKEILNSLKNDQAFHSRLFVCKHTRNFVIICQIHLGRFLLEE